MHTVDVEAISRSALDTPSDLFQSSLWAGAKARLGEQPLSFRFRYAGRWYPLLVVVRPLSDRYYAGYIPWGADRRAAHRHPAHRPPPPAHAGLPVAVAGHTDHRRGKLSGLRHVRHTG